MTMSRALSIFAALLSLSACDVTYETPAAVDEVSVTNVGDVK